MSARQAPRTSLAGAAALITGARTVQMLVVFLLSIPLARILTKSEYGAYMHTTLLASVLPVLLSAPLGKMVVYFLPRTGDPQQLLRRVAGVQLTVAVLIALAFALVPDVIQFFDPKDPLLVTHRLEIGLIIGASFPYTIGEQVLLARGLRRGWGLVLLVVALSLLVGIGGALAFAPAGSELPWALRGLLGATLVQALIVLYWLWRPLVADDPSRPQVAFRDVAAFVVPVMAASGISLLAIRMDGFLVPWFFGGTDAKALFLRGAMEPPVIGALAFTLLSLIAPELSRLHADGDDNGAVYLWRRTCRLVALITVPVVGAVQAVANDLFLLVYPDYPGAVPVFRVYTALMLVRIFLPQVLMENTGAAKRTTWVAAANLYLAAFLSLVLIYFGGYVGAAIAMFLATLIANWVVAGSLARRHLGVRWRDVLDWAGLLRLLAAAGIGWAAGHFTLQLEFAAGYGHFTRVLIGCVAYSVAALAVVKPLRAVHSEDVAALRQMILSRLPGRAERE